MQKKKKTSLVGEKKTSQTAEKLCEHYVSHVIWGVTRIACTSICPHPQLGSVFRTLSIQRDVMSPSYFQFTYGTDQVFSAALHQWLLIRNCYEKYKEFFMVTR